MALLTDETSAASRLDKIISKDSPLMERARTKGFQVANSRGLLNSSIAAGEAMNSMIDAAIPLAQSDATSALTVSENSRDRGFRSTEAEKDRDLTRSENIEDRKFQGNQNRLDRGFTREQNQLDRDLNQQIARWNLDASEQGNVSSILASYEAADAQIISAINSNPELDAQTRTNLLNDAKNRRDGRIALVETVYDIDLGIPRSKTSTKKGTGSATSGGGKKKKKNAKNKTNTTPKPTDRAQ